LRGVPVDADLAFLELDCSLSKEVTDESSSESLRLSEDDAEVEVDADCNMWRRGARKGVFSLVGLPPPLFDAGTCLADRD
jgi:hypothetical protein